MQTKWNTVYEEQSWKNTTTTTTTPI